MNKNEKLHDVGAYCETCQTARHTRVVYLGTKSARRKTYECGRCSDSWEAFNG